MTKEEEMIEERKRKVINLFKQPEIWIILLVIIAGLWIAYQFNKNEQKKQINSNEELDFSVARLRFATAYMYNLTDEDIKDYFTAVCKRADLEVASINPPACYKETDGINKIYPYVWVQEKEDYFQR